MCTTIMLYYIIVYITAATALEVDEKALLVHIPIMCQSYSISI